MQSLSPRMADMQVLDVNAQRLWLCAPDVVDERGQLRGLAVGRFAGWLLDDLQHQVVPEEAHLQTH